MEDDCAGGRIWVVGDEKSTGNFSSDHPADGDGFLEYFNHGTTVFHWQSLNIVYFNQII